MTAPRRNAAQQPSDDNTGAGPTLSGTGAKAGCAPGKTSGASARSAAEELIAQAEQILAAAAAAGGSAKMEPELIDNVEAAEVCESAVCEGAQPEVAEVACAEACEVEGCEAGVADAPEVEVLEPEVVEPEPASAASADELAAAKAEAADWQGRYLRLHAEWDTYRRRQEAQRKEDRARAAEKLVEELLPVLDDFERTVEYGKKNGEAGILGGVEAVQTKLMSVLAKEGVEIIDPAGAAFDALECQAVATVPDASVPDETVAQVYQKGFKMGGHVLRPAMVTVTTGGPRREVSAE